MAGNNKEKGVIWGVIGAGGAVVGAILIREATKPPTVAVPVEPQRAAETAPPTSPLPQLEGELEGKRKNCKPINDRNPNGFQAWKALGKPPLVEFCNYGGPDANNTCTTIEVDGDPLNLPKLVHGAGSVPGLPPDMFCRVSPESGFHPQNPFRGGSKPVVGSYGGVFSRI